MDRIEIKTIVYNLLKPDTYCKKYDALKSDVEFFRMYMERNKQSEFRFDLRISCGNSYKAFDDIWKKHGLPYVDSSGYLEDVFAEFTLLEMIITDIYKGTNIFTDAEIKHFIDYFEQDDDTYVKDYVSDFVDCYYDCLEVLQKLENIKEKDK